MDVFKFIYNPSKYMTLKMIPEYPFPNNFFFFFSKVSKKTRRPLEMTDILQA